MMLSKTGPLDENGVVRSVWKTKLTGKERMFLRDMASKDDDDADADDDVDADSNDENDLDESRKGDTIGVSSYSTSDSKSSISRKSGRLIKSLSSYSSESGGGIIGGLLAGIHGLFYGRYCGLIRRVTCGYPWPGLEGNHKDFGMIQERFRSPAWCLRDQMSTPTQCWL
ncbi:hypothetical protein Tco_0408376 [Tanacetum coccineum]